MAETTDVTMSSIKSYLVQAVYEWIIDNGCIPYLDADTTVPGVKVPPHFLNAGKITLNISPRAVNKFRMGHDGFEFEAKIGGAVAKVYIPMQAITSVCARENGQGMAFAVEHVNAQNVASSVPPPPEKTPAKSKPKLQIISGGE